MVLIIGGRFQGKYVYLESLTNKKILDCSKGFKGSIINKEVIYGLESYIKTYMESGGAIETLLAEVDLWQAEYIVGCEIGLGVVPMDPFERAYRDNVGLIYQKLVKRANLVTRVFAGIPVNIKSV